ncbi:protein Tob1-like [Babylonia areolata]|uniref:protein Tob1-like n=1 Tax=Babylonia areolata TaxID=304850 RepID=UPI003FD3DE4D
MKEEINCAVDFVLGFAQKADVPWNALLSFRLCLIDHMNKKYLNHWYSDRPFKGSSYRCIVVSENKIDPILSAALNDAYLDPRQIQDIRHHLPKELAIWVDPCEVSYRFGCAGSVGVLYSGSSITETTSDSESGTSSSGGSSPCSTRPPSV